MKKKIHRHRWETLIGNCSGDKCNEACACGARRRRPEPRDAGELAYQRLCKRLAKAKDDLNYAHETVKAMTESRNQAIAVARRLRKACIESFCNIFRCKLCGKSGATATLIFHKPKCPAKETP